MNTVTLTIYSNAAEYRVAFPARWIICDECEGCGTDRGRNVECDGPYGEGGNGFTASEWDEQDEEFREDYLAGRYDQPCGCCKGLGRVQVVDRERVTGWRNRIFLRAFDRQERDSAEIDAISRMERRMGA